MSAALITGLWGGLLALERRAFLQAALSRPLPAAVGVGVMLGDVQAGLMVGLVFELFHLGGASLGLASSEHELLPSVAGAALAATMAEAAGADSTPAQWVLAVLVCAPLGLVGRAVEVRLDTRAARYLGRVVTAVDHGDVQRALRQNLRAMWPHFAFFGLCAAVAPLLGPSLALLVERAPVRLLHGLEWCYPVLGTVAAASAVYASAGQGRLRVAGAAALLVALVLFAALGARSWS
ncbi:MAG: PTS sugar transporter subunit IIC [Myxococcaceae bacterium]|nr:PTS sugar transporter subunit IIC [Myxococcaceae bacterium]